MSANLNTSPDAIRLLKNIGDIDDTFPGEAFCADIAAGSAGHVRKSA